MIIVTAIMEKADKSVNQDISSRSHPSAGARYLNILNYLRAEVFNEFSDEFMRGVFIINLINESSEIYQTLGCDIPNFDSIVNYYAKDLNKCDDKCIHELISLEKSSKRLIRVLEPYIEKATNPEYY
jgi:hypothetical protein